MRPLETAAARWSLDLLSNCDVVEGAVEALMAGSDGEATVLIAGMADPLDQDVRPYIPDFFREQGCAVPPPPLAAKALVDEAVASMVSGGRSAIEAARDIVAVRVARENADQFSVAALAEQLHPFEMTFDIAAGSEWTLETLETTLLDDAEPGFRSWWAFGAGLGRESLVF